MNLLLGVIGFTLLSSVLAVNLPQVSRCLDNTFPGSQSKSVPCRTSCITQYNVTSDEIKQRCSMNQECSSDIMTVQNYRDTKNRIEYIELCCVSSDNCNIMDLSPKIYAPLPFVLRTCYDSDAPGFMPCKTSCETVYDANTNLIKQGCSSWDDVCFKDTLTINTETRQMRFCCLSSDNCNLLDWTEAQTAFRRMMTQTQPPVGNEDTSNEQSSSNKK